MSELVQSKLILGDESEYEGYIIESDRLWNGWHNPLFSKDVAIKIYQDIMSGDQEGVGSIKETKNAIELFLEDELFDSSKRVVIDGKELYRVGNYGFCWDIA